MNLAGFGCSMVYGFSDEARSPSNPNNSVAYHLSKKLNREYINCAANGSGNDLIYQYLITHHYSGKINPKDTFVLIGWSEGFRRKVFYDDEVCETFRPHITLSNPDKEYWDAHTDALFSGHFMNTNQNYYDSLTSIIGSYHLLENFGYQYLMFDSLTILNDGQGSDIDDYQINPFWIPEEFVNVKNSIKNYFTNIQYNHFLDNLYSNGNMPYLSEDNHHPNEYGAKEFSKILYEEIK